MALLSLNIGHGVIFLFSSYVLAFIVQLFYYIFVFRKVSNYKINKVNDQKLPVTIIICARNEASNLKKFLPSILTQDYPLSGQPDRSGQPLLLPPAVRALDRLRAVFAIPERITPGLIISLRGSMGLTQGQFGQKLGVSKMTVNRWEGGRMRPGHRAVRAILKLQAKARRDGVKIDGDKTPSRAATSAHRRHSASAGGVGQISRGRCVESTPRRQPGVVAVHGNIRMCDLR